MRRFLSFSLILCFFPTKYFSDQTVRDQIPLTDDIPCFITKGKAQVTSKMIAILFSGDGGWYGFEQSIADHLADFGISTIGIDTRKYFWDRKTPEKTASDMAGLLISYGKEWGISQYMLIGYSQGSEILPFVFTLLPEKIKSNLTSIVMLSPEATTDFEIHLSNILGIGSRQNTYDVIAEISGIQTTRQIIIFGESEKTSVPDLLKGTNIEITRIPGDHHYKRNSALIVQTMKDKKAF